MHKLSVSTIAGSVLMGRFAFVGHAVEYGHFKDVVIDKIKGLTYGPLNVDVVKICIKFDLFCLNIN